jgi:hypothetical protein
MRFAGVVWLCARRSVMWRLVVPLCLAGVLLGHAETAPGLYEWTDRAGAVAAALTLLLPLACGVSCLDGSRWRRSASCALIRTASDGGLGAGVAQALSVTGLAGAVFALVSVGVHVPWADAGVPAGGPEWSWLVSSLASLVAASLAGFVIGLAAPWWWTAPASCIAAYAIGVVLVVLGGAVTPNTPLLSPLFVGSPGPFARVNDELFVWRAVCFAGIAVLCLAVLLLAYVGTRRRVLVLSITAAVATVVSGLTVATSASSLTGPPVAEATCGGAKPRLCLVSAYEPARNRIGHALAPIEKRLHGTPFEFVEVELIQRGTAPASAESVGLSVDDLADGWPARDLPEFVQSILDDRRPGAVCAAVGPAQPMGLVYGPGLVFLGWATGLREIAEEWDGGGAAYDSLTRLTAAEQRNWMHDAVADICRGEPRLDDLGGRS